MNKLLSVKGKLTTAKKQYGKAERELYKHDDTLLRLEIEELEKDIGYLEAFEKASRALKMPKAE
jgi:formiminotetrahydrofolate cyclodeaminase